MEKQKFYITTPIYYPSDKLHIGHTYCTVATDAMARYKRLTGCDVLFLTGTDEHGQKIEDKAKAAGKTPKEFLDNIVEGPQGILDLWKLMNISNDRFIRTTDDYHCASIQKIFRKMYEKGDIYKGTYKGKYCKPCESFWTESQLVDGKCPDCGREVMDAEEEAYFFRLSKYADRVRHLLEDTDFLQPRSRVNEMVNNFIKPGLEDLCVSRTSFSWGIPVDFDPGHVVYVWVDALFNYTTALGFMNDRYHDYDKYWPADVHFVGKEIVRFHSIIWPAMLMSMDMPLPKHVYGHGWLVMDGGKMSKSKGNVVDPYVLAEKFGVDALRFFLLRTFPFGSDGNFSNELLIQTINMDLANDLGNLVSRTTAMVEKYFGGTLPAERENSDADCDLKTMASTLRDRYEAEMERFQFQNAMEQVFRTIQRANKYIDENAPWTLAKDPANRARLATVMYNLLETVRICAVLLTPFIPDSAEKIFDQIGACPCCRTWEKANVWGSLRPDVTVHKGEALFPRGPGRAQLHPGGPAQGGPARPGAGALYPGAGGLRYLLPVRFPGREDQGLRACEEVRQAAEVHSGRWLRHGPHHRIRHPALLPAGAAHRQNCRGHSEPAPPEDDGHPQLRHADLRRPQGKGRGEAAPPAAGRLHPRRRQALLTTAYKLPPPAAEGVCLFPNAPVCVTLIQNGCKKGRGCI